MKVQRLKGFRDILPAEGSAWRRVEAAAARVFTLHGFQEVRLPLLEETPLFQRSIGEATDIVEKEMYTFEDTGGTTVTLRPEGTASAVRAYIENGCAASAPKARWYYAGPMFRRERPQKGRFRQFHQIGAECFGWSEPGADADLLCMLWDFARALGISDRVSLEVNSLGCADDRARYVDELRAFLAPRAQALCENCRRRAERNPLRVIDCKSEHCREATRDAPLLGSHLCAECAGHFSAVRGLLDAQRVPYRVNPRMVRGLDYYNRTTFELVTGELGAQNAVAAGGRYDGLVETLGGPAVPALGFAVGVERLVLLAGEGEKAVSRTPVFCVHRGAGAFEAAFAFRRECIGRGAAADLDYEPRSFKAQMRSADACGARFAAIFGEDEVAEGAVTLKDLGTGAQEKLAVGEALTRVEAAMRMIREEEERC